MKKIIELDTGDTVPEGAIFLQTVSESLAQYRTNDFGRHYQDNDKLAVKHYFLIEKEV